MTFLAPFATWWWLLALLPILIHLFNRLRHRKMPWAAMMFLRMANRKSTRYAKLRQWLVLLFRCLAIAALLFALSRPLASGFVSSMFSAKPDVILVILDGSASMGAQSGEGTRYEAAVDMMAKAADQFEGTRLVMMRHNDERPSEVKDAQALRNLAGMKVTDTGADLPTLLEAAVNWFEETKPGRGEIWIASDLQTSSWDPARKETWGQVSGNLVNLPQKVSVRLMAFNQPLPDNVSVRVAGVQRVQDDGVPKVQMQIELSSGSVLTEDVELDVFIDGKKYTASENGENMGGISHVIDTAFALPDDRKAGSGYVSLINSEDGNRQDNRAFFVYGAPDKVKAAVVGDEAAFSTAFLKLAAAPNPANTNQVSEVIAPGKLETAPWGDYAMVLWQGALPEGKAAEQLTEYIKNGGIMVCFPEIGNVGGSFQGVQWGEVQRVEHEGKQFENWQALVAAEGDGNPIGFLIDNYETAEGPFRTTEEGLFLPLTTVRINQRRTIEFDEGTVLASLAGGEAVVLRKNLDKGQLYFFGTSPNDAWSSLTEGIVLVPALQRLMAEGEAMSSGRYVLGRLLEAGDTGALQSKDRWLPVSSEAQFGQDPFEQSGVYRLSDSDRVVAINRPENEDLGTTMNAADVEKLFGEVPVALTQETAEGGSGDDPKEIWRWFLVAMALALLIEGLLILPKGADERVEIQRSSTGKVQTQQAV